MKTGHERSNEPAYTLRLIAWELTRACPLACPHCRASARQGPYEGELSTDECRAAIDRLAAFARPILILTGGEPLLRADVYDLAGHAHARALRVVLATCGALLDDSAARKLLGAGVSAVSLSLDGATPASHDAARGADGAFQSAMRGASAARQAGLALQINTTITQDNLGELPDILALAARLGAVTFNPFLLVPTGRGRALADRAPSAEQCERTLTWLARQRRGDIAIRVTCAPHYQRILRQLGQAPGPQAGGCLGGKQFAFISHRGQVQVCGFLDLSAGDLRRTNLDLRPIWEHSPLFRRVRDTAGYRGRCGRCEFISVCGGCRARAWETQGDLLGEEPCCEYQPREQQRQSPPRGKSQAPNPKFQTNTKHQIPNAERANPSGLRGDAGGTVQGEAPAVLETTDRALLARVQAGLPLVDQPFAKLGEPLGLDGQTTAARLASLRYAGVIRRVGAMFDSRALGYVSTLVTARVAPRRIHAVAQAVNAIPGVTHNYRRRHAYNLWFTLTSEGLDAQRLALRRLSERTEQKFFVLPALAVYKLRVELPLDDEPATAPAQDAPATPAWTGAAPAALHESQRALVRLLQEGLPLVDRPFDELARRLGWTPRQVLDQLGQWTRAGVIRRLGAVLHHRRAGFLANALAVFDVPDDRVDQAAQALARPAAVSHCYRRARLPDFPYNLYAMIHARRRRDIATLLADLPTELADCPRELLFSILEYKKTAMRYFA